MDEQEMLALLNSSGIPFAYQVWRSPPKLPWGVFRVGEINEFYADGVLYYAVRGYQIELYTAKKDQSAEEMLENALTAAGISFGRSEDYIESERLYQIIYDCEV